MAILENAKKIMEMGTGYGQPNIEELETLIKFRKPNFHYFKDDGQTPNSQNPLIYYRSPIRLDSKFDPAAIFEMLFANNNWKSSWRDSIYNFLHFHTNRHEVLGIARGHAQVRFGGKKGRKIKLKAGDVVILPAGTGHYRLSKSRDLLVVGAYPTNSGEYDQPRPNEINHTVALKNISRVKKPTTDPVYGTKGPLIQYWV